MLRRERRRDAVTNVGLKEGADAGTEDVRAPVEDMLVPVGTGEVVTLVGSPEELA